MGNDVTIISREPNEAINYVSHYCLKKTGEDGFHLQSQGLGENGLKEITKDHNYILIHMKGQIKRIMNIHEKYELRTLLWIRYEENKLEIKENEQYKEYTKQIKKENEEIDKLTKKLTDEIKEDKKNNKEWR